MPARVGQREARCANSVGIACTALPGRPATLSIRCASTSSISTFLKAASRSVPWSRAMLRAHARGPARGRRLEDRIVRDLPELLQPGDVLVLNDTKVIPSRLYGLRVREETRRARRDHAAQARKRRPLARLRAPGQEAPRRRPHPLRTSAESTGLRTRRLDARSRRKARAAMWRLRFSFSGAYLDEAIARLGELPLPPYIAGKRPTDDKRPDRLPDDLCAGRGRGRRADRRPAFHPRPASRALDARGVGRHFVTLHVGAGTFLPVKADDTAEHRMHAEWGDRSRRRPRGRSTRRGRAGGRLVAVGTTSPAPARERGRRGRDHRAVLRATPRSSSRPAIASRRSTG